MNLPIIKKPLIRTERLTIKPYAPSDTERLAALLTNRVITETFMVPEFETLGHPTALAAKLVAFSQPEDTKHLEYGIYSGGVLIGFINDCGIEEDEIEIGYVIHPDYKGHGYATEAVGAVINELRGMGFKKVTAGFFSENTASRRVMEKCGMVQNDEEDEEEYRGVTHKCYYCEIKL